MIGKDTLIFIEGDPLLDDAMHEADDLIGTAPLVLLLTLPLPCPVPSSSPRQPKATSGTEKGVMCC